MFCGQQSDFGITTNLVSHLVHKTIENLSFKAQCLKTVASNGPFLSSTKQRLALFSIWTNTFSDPMIKMNIPMIERRFRQMLLIFWILQDQKWRSR